MSENIQKGGQVDVVYIDLSKAFDRVSHTAYITHPKTEQAIDAIACSEMRYLFFMWQNLPIEGKRRTHKLSSQIV